MHTPRKSHSSIARQTAFSLLFCYPKGAQLHAAGGLMATRLPFFQQLRQRCHTAATRLGSAAPTCRQTPGGSRCRALPPAEWAARFAPSSAADRQGRWKQSLGISSDTKGTDQAEAGGKWRLCKTCITCVCVWKCFKNCQLGVTKPKTLQNPNLY